MVRSNDTTQAEPARLPETATAARGRGIRVDDETRQRVEAFEWRLPGKSTAGFAAFEDDDAHWNRVSAPATASRAAREAGLEDVPFDEAEHLFRARFRAPTRNGGRRLLYIPGLATQAEVWLNGERLLSSDSMYVGHTVDVTDRLGQDNLLGIRVLPLGLDATPKRPRQRWRTELCDARLRFVRTTLLGRMPGFCPPTPPVGPFRPIEWVDAKSLVVQAAALSCRLDGHRGRVEATVDLREVGRDRPATAALIVGGERTPGKLIHGPDGTVRIEASLSLDDVEPWWPHTHGAPRRYSASLEVQAAGATRQIDLGQVGFRELLGPGGGRPRPDGLWPDIQLQVNGIVVFCRGACWMPLDIASPHATRDAYREALTAMRDAGMNMVRVPGTCLYEADDFYDLCDELGILVWQDFMLARFDYPESDAVFSESFFREAHQLLGRLDHRPCLAVLCGGSEIEQQAAMFGLTRDRYRSELASRKLPELVAERRPDVPYVRGSPSGGVLPFDVSVGVSHYFGVGAYERPLSDASLRPPRFATEALAFSCWPEPSSLGARTDPDALLADPILADRVPRDPGASWTFARTTDFYMARLFGVDAHVLRAESAERYLELARIVPGEVMAATLATLRRPESPCRGLLIWLWHDPWPAPGFGVLDALGRPKAAYYYLRRVCAPTAVLFEDAGLDGLSLHVVHDGPEPIEAQLVLTLYRADGLALDTARAPAALLAHGATPFRAEALFGRFFDSTYSYRFGPPSYAVAVARLMDQSGALLSEAFYRPTGFESVESTDLSLSMCATPDAELAVTIETNRFAQAVRIEAEGLIPADNYFHMAAGSRRTVPLRALAPSHRAELVTVKAVNSEAATIGIPDGRAR